MHRSGKTGGVLFRTDGGRIKGLSLGHVFRCLALAREFRDRYSIAPTFMMKDLEAGVRVVEDAGFEVQRLAVEIDEDTVTGEIIRRPETAIVFDLPGPPRSTFQRLADARKRIIVIEDLRSSPNGPELTVNGNVAFAQDCSAATSAEARCFLGPKYAVLGHEFDRSLERTTTKRVEKILVTCGGSDPTGLTVKIIGMLNDCSTDAVISVALGPGFSDDGALRDIVRDSAIRYEFHRNVDDLGSLMRDAGFAVATAGRTAYELAATGTPTLLIPSIDHEETAARAFSAAGCALTISLGGHGDFPDAFARMLSDADLRASQSRNGPLLVDGKGRHRVARIIKEQCR